MFIVPAMKNSDQVSRGRGKGGLATIWKKNLTKYVSRIKCRNFRLQATKFSLPGSSLLVINTYFPCDPQNDNFDDTELVTVLADLEDVIRDSQCTDILLTGDLNCDFRRQTRFTSLVKDCMTNLGLLVTWQNPDNDPQHHIETVDYTHCSITRGVASYSTIDHFGASQRVFNAISEAGVIHSGENTSNHSAIFAKVNVDDLDLTLEVPRLPPRVSWDRANTDAQDKYRASLAKQLNEIILPDSANCRDLHCTKHSDFLEEYTMSVMQAVESASKTCLPLSGQSRRQGGAVAGWNDHVRPYAEESKFWESIWISLGRPNQGETFAMMKDSKRQYKYAVRRLKRVNDKIINEKFLSSIISGGADIFKEIRKLRGTSSTFSSRIDQEVGQENIAKHFATIYSELYNRVEVGEELEKVSDTINTNINQDSTAQLDRVNEDTIREALKLMKSKKQDPYFVLLCTLMPLFKDNLGDITASSNYRAIAGGSLLLKLLDIVILQLEGHKLSFDQLQFAYQEKSSTVMCSWTVTAVIEHFNRSGSVVYGAAMDMSKAFDLVEWSQLFLTLVQRQVEPILLRLMLFIYRNQRCDVKWCSK